MVVHQQADVQQFDLLPYVHGLLAGLEFALQAVGAFQHPQVIKLDALTLGALLAVPVGRFKAVLGARRFGAKQAVVAVKAIHHRFGNVVSEWRVQAGGEHGTALTGAGRDRGNGSLVDAGDIVVSREVDVQVLE